MIRPFHRLAFFCLAAALAVSASPLRAQVSGYEAEQIFGKNKIQYRNFRWNIYHSPHFNVYYYSAEEVLLPKVVSFAESAYDTLSREFNYQIKEPVPLIFYATHSAFEQNNVILNFIEEGIGAFASPARFRMVLPVDSPDAFLIKLISHELTHIFQYHILYQGNLARSLASGPPTWFIEGMASYMGKDEQASDRMFLRDFVVNDRIPSVTQDIEGYPAYRYGHAVFDFIEERWGKEGFLDFLDEMRNSLGGRVDRALKRAFKLETEDFDLEFRRWLRKKYLGELIKTGEPSDFGRLFREKDKSVALAISPSAAPSGDLVASMGIVSGEVGVVLFDTAKRIHLRNVTPRHSNDYQYLSGQFVSAGRGLGRDLSFSPDGNTIAVFAKREKGRSLLLLDVLHGGIRRIVDMDDVEQQQSPNWSPDSKHIVFAGSRKGQFDIFTVDLDSLAITNLTDDEVFDGAPVYSPDGRSVVFVSAVGKADNNGTGVDKLFRIDLDKPGQRYQLTTVEGNDNDPIFSTDGTRVYFTSDRDGTDNIYSLELATGKVQQYTNVVTGAFMPSVLRSKEGNKERLVFTGYWKGNFDLYVTDTDQPVREAAPEKPATAPSTAKELPRYEPDIQVTVDNSNKEKYGGRKFFLEDAQAYAGVQSDQTILGRVLLSFSDYLGDRRILANFSSIESFSNFDFTYANLSKRQQWQIEVFDHRTFYIAQDSTGFLTRGRAAFQETGALASLIYPFTFYHRAEIGLGYIVRKIDFQEFVFDQNGNPVPVVVPVDDNFPLLQASIVGDSARFAEWGPISGRRWRLEGSFAPSTKGGGSEFTTVSLDLRQYVPLTQRSNFAFRVFLGTSSGKTPNPFFFGGLDTLRAFDYATVVGDRAFFANAEIRFPLVDVFATPILGFRGIRGVIFFDTGGAYFHRFQRFQYYDSDTKRLKDGVAAYGWGITTQLLGLDVNWDFARQWDLKQQLSGYRTDFWIGTRF
ncbi:MAG TPA: BamA/TamA family outer membrane protein [Thermoanaerobaculia bacterium]|nr:BamA/TamA family outer membrane protein [Thermoanaerobaculia bacterium]